MAARCLVDDGRAPRRLCRVVLLLLLLTLTLLLVSRCSSSLSTDSLADAMLRCAAVRAVAREWMGAVTALSCARLPPNTSSSDTDSLVSRLSTCACGTVVVAVVVRGEGREFARTVG